jgi:hypothetical protein
MDNEMQQGKLQRKKINVPVSSTSEIGFSQTSLSSQNVFSPLKQHAPTLHSGYFFVHFLLQRLNNENRKTQKRICVIGFGSLNEERSSKAGWM